MLKEYRTQCLRLTLDYSAFLRLKDRLVKLIDPEQDSLRFYYLGNNWEKRVEHVGPRKPIIRKVLSLYNDDGEAGMIVKKQQVRLNDG